MRNLTRLLLISATAWLASAALLTTTLRAESTVSLPTSQCVWHPGDNPAWAAPDLDQSSWQPYMNWNLSADVSRIWVRCTVDLSRLRDTTQPALQLSLGTAFELYFNGKLAGGTGNPSSGSYSFDTIHTFPLPAGSFTPVPSQLAIRITFRDNTQSSPIELYAGDQSALQNRRDHEALDGARRYVDLAICYTVIGVIGFMLFGLYLNDRSRGELLALAFVCWCMAILRILDFAAEALVPMSSTLWQLLYGIGQAVEIPFQLFMFWVAGKRVPRVYWYTSPVYMGFVAVLLVSLPMQSAMSLRVNMLMQNNAFVSVLLVAGALVALCPFVAFWPWNRIEKTMRPLAAFCMVWGLTEALWLVLVLGSLSASRKLFLLHHYVVFIDIRALVSVSAVVALLALLFRNQRRVAQERAELHGEMASAREIQQYLIPETLPSTPGLVIRSAYQPAREVGGDFFQVLPDSRDGSTLIVVGDVAGKGLQAGMLAALIVGAIRTAFQFTSDPGRILALLNERLQGRGLVTCLALRIGRDGSAEIANAGQIPPYINGKELTLDGALPLGALPNATFPPAKLELAPGQSILLVSDGVVEARNAKGELFGFERVAAISSESAQDIADAAKQFGQEDDITVLTLEFSQTPAPVDEAHRESLPTRA